MNANSMNKPYEQHVRDFEELQTAIQSSLIETSRLGTKFNNYYSVFVEMANYFDKINNRYGGFKKI